MSRVQLTSEAQSELDDLTKATAQWRKTAERQLMRYADDAGPEGDFVGGATPGDEENAEPNTDQNKDALDTDMESFLQRTQKWLAPLFATRQMAGALRALQGEPAGLVLLLDPILHSLPVEACKEIRDTHLGVSRDFSIHAFIRKARRGRRLRGVGHGFCGGPAKRGHGLLLHGQAAADGAGELRALSREPETHGFVWTGRCRG